MVCIPHYHGDGLPAPELLHHVEIYSGLDQPRGPCVPEVMEAEVFYFRLFHCQIIRTKEISGIPLVASSVKKDVPGLNGWDFRSTLHHIESGRIQRQRIFRSVFLLQDGNRPAKQIHLWPFQVQNLALPKPRMKCKENDLLQPRR